MLVNYDRETISSQDVLTGPVWHMYVVSTIEMR